jgi:probable rRNA maturation factor
MITQSSVFTQLFLANIYIVVIRFSLCYDKNYGSKYFNWWLIDIAERVLKAEKAGPKVEMGILITNQGNIRTLNLTYRNINEPTDVLSFYMMPEPEQAKETFIMPPDNVKHIGEVVISYPQAIIQARENKHTVKKEITVLLIHGILHLLGYDHEKPVDEKKMKPREAAILKRIGDN